MFVNRLFLKSLSQQKVLCYCLSLHSTLIILKIRRYWPFLREKTCLGEYSISRAAKQRVQEKPCHLKKYIRKRETKAVLSNQWFVFHLAAIFFQLVKQEKGNSCFLCYSWHPVSALCLILKNAGSRESFY